MTTLERMEHMGAAGCIVALRFGPFGWGATVQDPDVDGINVTQFQTPDAAMEALHVRWEEKRAAWWEKQV